LLKSERLQKQRMPMEAMDLRYFVEERGSDLSVSERGVHFLRFRYKSENVSLRKDGGKRFDDLFTPSTSNEPIVDDRHTQTFQAGGKRRKVDRWVIPLSKR
jgi:hypothetical protein